MYYYWELVPLSCLDLLNVLLYFYSAVLYYYCTAVLRLCYYYCCTTESLEKAPKLNIISSFKLPDWESVFLRFLSWCGDYTTCLTRFYWPTVPHSAPHPFTGASPHRDSHHTYTNTLIHTNEYTIICTQTNSHMHKHTLEYYPKQITFTHRKQSLMLINTHSIQTHSYTNTYTVTHTCRQLIH